ncbi:MAG: nitrate/nitrite transporter [Burkholderiales bacterium]
MSASANATASKLSPRFDAHITVSLVIICQSFQSLAIGGIALFLPLIREDLEMSFSQGGMLSAAATITYGLGQIPAGYLADRYGAKRLFFIGLLGCLALSFNLAWVQSFEGALVNQLISGVFRALLFAPGLVLITAWFPPDRRAMAMGLFVIGGMSGNVFLSLAGPILVEPFGWRVLFMIFAMCGIVTATLYHVLGKEKVRIAPKKEVRMRDAADLFRYPIMWVCGALQFIRFGVVTSFSFWLPSLLVADRGMSLAEAGWTMAMAAALTGPSNALGGYVSDRIKNPPLVIGASIAILGCTAILLVTVTWTPLMLLVIAINAIFLQFYFGPLFHVPVEVLGSRVTGMSAGVSNMFANAGALVFAVSLGVIRDKAGSFAIGFIAIAAFCLLGVVLAWVLARMRHAALADTTSATAISAGRSTP